MEWRCIKSAANVGLIITLFAHVNSFLHNLSMLFGCACSIQNKSSAYLGVNI